ncbi:MAG: glycoside hydrolase family 38 C-terminal domain-containing protein [Bacteroidota bacterium]|nr:glycoside hydrolase family 38 C-terminal domain-containing protein [Bacteroidota bacterium]
MRRKSLLFLILILPVLMFAQPMERRAKYDISKDRVLYTVGYTHLDSEYEWDYKTTVSEYLKNTMEENFRLFDKYPDYVFNFTGARRYRLMKEYYPELYKKIKGYVEKERWNVAGSSMEEGEVNASSPESVIRQVLYGNNYFHKEFGKVSSDYMLPDCFGFVASLPTVLHHTGLIGFSTQKLTIGNLPTAVPLPFNVGIWNGPDGKGLVACLDATDYDGDLLPRLDIDKYWDNRLAEDYKKYGISFDYRYYGCGDMGGGLRDRDVINAQGSLNNQDSKIKVVLTSSDQMFKDITPEIKKKLPVFSGDLLLVEHSAGSMTSQSYMKRLNRKNEILAQSSELMASMANYLTNTVYPHEKLNNSWELVLGSQMHDVLPGTAIPSAFELAWNDEFVAQNGFSEVLKNSLGEVSSQLNTQTKGRAVAVYNPVAIEREDVCTAEMEYAAMPAHIRVFDAKGKEVPSQITVRSENKIKFIFIARIPSLGVAVYDVRESSSSSKLTTASLVIKPNILENEYYKLTINNNGDIASILDKKQNREILKNPARLEFQHEIPKKEPSWNMFWYDRKNPPFAFMNEEVSIKMIENGPVRVALEVSKKGQNSGIKQIVSLSAGDAGKRIEVDNILDWQSTGVSLKASFPFVAENENATYNLGVGTIQRNTNHETKFEVPSKKWFDLTDQSGEFGVSVLEDCRYGSDKPDANTLRLTLEYTPSAKLCPTWLYQASQDWGIQNVKYGLYSHSGDWSQSETQWQAEFLNQPLLAFESPKHAGIAGSEFSFMSISSPKVGLMALKKAEQGDYFIVRVNELSGNDLTGIYLKFPGKIMDAYEVNGQEQKIGEASIAGNSMNFDLSHYTIRSFAFKLAPHSQPAFVQSNVDLGYDQDVMSFDDNRTDGNMTRNYDPTDHGNVRNYPAEMIPSELVSEGVKFKMGSTADLQKNVVTCQGQTIKLPAGDYNKLYILAAATDETSGTFTVNGKPVNLAVAKWTGFIGQHYDRQFDLDGHTVLSVKEPFIKHGNIAWFASHYHFGYPTQNVPYTYSYIFKYEINLPQNAGEITLPDNFKIKIFAITVAKKDADDVQILQPLSDDFKENGPFVLKNVSK